MTTAAENLVDRNFSSAELGVMMALVMCDWNTRDAERCFVELGGHPAAYNRILASLLADKVIKSHPRRLGFMQLDQLCEALRLRYERAVAAREARDASNR